LREVHENIDRLHGEIENYRVTIENLETEIANLNEREVLIEEARAVDVKTYASRK